jgi:hypothetical protein
MKEFCTYLETLNPAHLSPTWQASRHGSKRTGTEELKARDVVKGGSLEDADRAILSMLAEGKEIHGWQARDALVCF